MTDERPRAVLVLPGRGSYLGTSLGSLPADHPHVQEAEALRAELGLDSLLALDAADSFEPSVHLRPANASPLTFLVSLLDAERAMADHRVVAVIGNSLGWYTALTVAGALSVASSRASPSSRRPPPRPGWTAASSSTRGWTPTGSRCRR
jgi:hypothetical protein